MKNVSTVRWTADAEREIAHRILAIEDELTLRLESIPATAGVLAERIVRVGRTRSAAVDRLQRAVEKARTAPEADPAVVAAVVRRWSEAQGLRWRLALSATAVAHREAHRLAGNPVLDRADLLQEGLVGLLDAAKRYEPDRDIRFGTYARWWVRASMTRAIDVGRLIHLSAGASEQLRNLRKQIRIHEMAGSSWTAQDLAKDLGIEVDRVRTLLEAGVARSLNESSEDDDGSAEVQLADETGVRPDDAAASSQQIELLHGAIQAALTPRHQRVITERYGIGRQARTRTDIAKGLNLSRERVRQLEHESLALLRETCARGLPRTARPAHRQ